MASEEPQIIIDNSNIVKMPDLRIGLEAVGDKLTILYDTFKSGFECKLCKGTGTIVGREVYENGAWKSPIVTCPDCKGKGGLLVIPENAKSLPSTGLIVSVGPDCKLAHSKLGTRILFAPHVGTMLPMKNNSRFKVMREHEVLQVLHTDNQDIQTADFMDYETPLS